MGTHLRERDGRVVSGAAGSADRFEVVPQGDGNYAFRAVSNGLFLVAEGNGMVNANRANASGWETFRVLSVLDPGITQPFAGDWATPDGTWVIRVEGLTGTIVEGGDRARPPGTEMLRFETFDGTHYAVRYRSSGGAFQPATVELADGNLNFSMGRYVWSWSRVGPPPPRETPEDTVARIVDAYGLVDPAERAVAAEVVETALALYAHLAPTGVLERLGLGADEFALAAARSPETVIAIGAFDALEGMATEMIVDRAASALTDFLFKSTRLRDLPDRLQNPSRALVHSAMTEFAGVLLTGRNPSPTALVGPVVNRVYDIYEIHQASNALAAEQDTNLLYLAMGSEITARLKAASPGPRTEEVARLWRDETRAAVPGMVGPDDAEAVARILDLGLAALDAALAGDSGSAAAQVRQMVTLGEDGDGPFLLSAEGPIDLLVKLAAGGDAPARAVRAYLNATPLGEVVQRERITEALVTLPAGPWGGDPAVREALATMMANLAPREVAGCAVAYGPVPQPLWKPLFEGRGLSLVDPRGRESQRVATLAMLENDRFCLGTQVQCAAGAPPLIYCASGEALFMSGQTQILDVVPLPDNLAGERFRAQAWDDRSVTPAAPGSACAPKVSWPGMSGLRWSGACEGGKATGEGLLQAMQGPKVAWQIRVGPRWGTLIEEGGLWYDLDLTRVRFDLSACDAGFSNYRAVRVTLPPGTDEAFFWNEALLADLRQRAVNVALRLCPTDRGLANIAFSMHLPARPDEAMAWGRNYGQDSLDWREGGNRPADLLGRSLQEQERARLVEEQRRAAEDRAAALAAEFEARRAALVSRAEAMIDTRNGSLEDLALALEVDELAALEALEGGIELRIDPPQGTSSGEVNGRRVYLASYRVGSAFAALEAEFRQRQDFSWENWIEQTRASRGDRLDLTCQFRRLRDIPDSPTIVRAVLQDFASDGTNRRVSVSCR